MTLWQNSFDRGEFVGSILMELLKDYDCLKDFLCFSELQTCGFKILFLSYLTNRTQRIKRGSTFSDLTNIVKSILQRAILGPLLFNILINYSFFFSAKCQICYFVYDNSLYCCGMNLDSIFSDLIQDVKHIWMVCLQFTWRQILINSSYYPRK